MSKKKCKAATNCLNTEGIHAVFCNKVQIVLQRPSESEKKVQREQKETMHIEKLFFILCFCSKNKKEISH